MTRDTRDHVTLCHLSCDGKNKVTWNSGKRDPEAADVPDVCRGLHQGLDGAKRRGGLRGVVKPRARSGRLQLAGAQRVEVAVGGHVGAGGGREAHQHHQGGPGHGAQPPRGVRAHHPHH